MNQAKGAGRQAVLAMGLLAAIAATPVLTLAQDSPFPTRPITVVVPFPPGGSADLISRTLAPLVSQAMGVPVVVENRPGATGSTGAAFVARAEPTGYTVLMAPAAVLTVNQWLYKNLQYNPEKDFAPVTNAAATSNLWVVHPALAIRNLGELLALARSQPGSLSFASGGNGTSHHLCGEMLKTVAGVELIHVPYKGPSLALQDVLAGRVPLMCDNLSNVLPHVRTGRLRAITITASKRHSQAPDVPTAAEAGLAGFEFGVWFGFVAPAKTPKPVILRLNMEFARALHTPSVVQRLESLGFTVVADSPDDFGKFIAAEAAKGRRLVEASGAKLD